MKTEMAAEEEHQIVEKFAGARWQRIDRGLAKAVGQAINGLGAEQVAFSVSPNGTTIIVGESRRDRVEFDIKDLVAETPYTVFMRAEPIRAVFGQVGDWEPAIALIGPEDEVGLRFEWPVPRSDAPGPVIWGMYALKPTIK